jgi:hypothetical protein
MGEVQPLEGVVGLLVEAERMELERLQVAQEAAATVEEAEA